MIALIMVLIFVIIYPQGEDHLRYWIIFRLGL